MAAARAGISIVKPGISAERTRFSRDHFNPLPTNGGARMRFSPERSEAGVTDRRRAVTGESGFTGVEPRKERV